MATIPFAPVAAFRPPQTDVMGRALNIARTLQAMKGAQQKQEAEEQALQFAPTMQAATLAKLKALTEQAQQKAALSQAQAGLVPSHQALYEAQQEKARQLAEEAKTKALFTPDVEQQKAITVQKLKNQSDMAIAKLREKQDSPMKKAQATQLSGEMKNLSSEAQNAADIVIPNYQLLLNDLKQTGLVGPFGSIAWTSPAGRKLKNDMVRVQGEFIKQFHLGRMTQMEFNFLKSAIGTINDYPSTLRKMYSEQLERAHQAINKFGYYHNYIKKGGTDPNEVTQNWIDQQVKKEQAFPTAPTGEPAQQQSPLSSDLIMKLTGVS